ncbi:hypothetical protein BDN70DRAFT_844686 [Pholiota conissans]|uniref:Uncharacterized protein n=1 Tax=Pholiota conissans TaxID=109636 RepID=A0A9P5YLZ3_9AGAR|nr:hypothetical protein BDN70DRAFT_844686 [Pholiota conissans]
MAENPEWFLDAADFVSQPNTNVGAVPYPPHLEPPRGWCPARKKDLKDRGGEGWPEGEEPRLRCTFCRRTYAGVNAKSMWRRHVFEKHKIAMANRRDGNLDRPRGRGSGKENRYQAPPRNREETHDSLVSMVVAPQTVPVNVSHKSKFRSGKLIEGTKHRQDQGFNRERSVMQTSVKKNNQETDEDSEIEETTPAKSPPLTPHAEISSDPLSAMARQPDESNVNSPSVLPPVIPESPYNPLQTPSFRHCSPPLPFDQPWRYPSPSHPLHSNTRDLSLTIVTRPLPSPSKVDVNPMTMLAMHSSPLTSTPQRVSVTNFETPVRSKISGSKALRKKQSIKSYLTSPLNDIHRYHSPEQNLGHSLLQRPLVTPQRHARHLSNLSESWFSDSSLDHTSIPLASTNNDPFSIYDSWVNDSHISPAHLPKTRQEPESPVLRSGSLTSSAGLGLGLLEAFAYPSDDFLNDAMETDLKDMLTSPERRKRRSEGKRTALAGLSPAEISPPLKKRRISQETTNL